MAFRSVLRRVGCVGVPELGFFFVVEEDAFIPDALGVGVIAGGVIAGSAGEFALGVLFAGALGAAVDVEPGGGAGVDVLLGEVELVEGVGTCGVAELPDEGGDLVVGGVVWGGKGKAAVVVVEELEGGWGGGGGWCGGRNRGGVGLGRGSGGGGVAA